MMRTSCFTGWHSQQCFTRVAKTQTNQGHTARGTTCVLKRTEHRVDRHYLTQALWGLVCGEQLFPFCFKEGFRNSLIMAKQERRHLTPKMVSEKPENEATLILYRQSIRSISGFTFGKYRLEYQNFWESYLLKKQGTLKFHALLKYKWKNT